MRKTRQAKEGRIKGLVWHWLLSRKKWRPTTPCGDEKRAAYHFREVAKMFGQESTNEPHVAREISRRTCRQTQRTQGHAEKKRDIKRSSSDGGGHSRLDRQADGPAHRSASFIWGGSQGHREQEGGKRNAPATGKRQGRSQAVRRRIVKATPTRCRIRLSCYWRNAMSEGKKSAMSPAGGGRDRSNGAH